MALVRSLVFVALVATLAGVSAVPNKVVCYFGSWVVYRTVNPYPISAINASLCTHLVYAFANVDANGVVTSGDTYADLPAPNLNGYGKFNALKTLNPALKTLIAVGGGSAPSSVFSTVMASAAKRTAFVNNMASFAQLYQFNGVDLDWEYPAQNGGVAADKANMVLLLQEMRTKFTQSNLLMSSAVSNIEYSIALSYDVPALSTYLDFINVMAYDYYGAGWSTVTGQNAPLYTNPLVYTTPFSKTVNVDAGVRYWLANGANPSKLVLGVGLYGQTFTLANSVNRALGAATVGAGTAGPYTASPGTLSYNEICLQLKAGGWTVTNDTYQDVPFASKGTQWIGYDNPNSVALKTSYARTLGLGGVMVWSIEQDDFLGSCSGTKYPLLTAINRVLVGTQTLTEALSSTVVGSLTTITSTKTVVTTAVTTV